MKQQCAECNTQIKQGFVNDNRLFCTQTCLDDYGLPPKLKQRNQKRHR